MLLRFQDLMVGDEASQLRSMLEVSYPMENGVSDEINQVILPDTGGHFFIYRHTLGHNLVGC